MAVSCFSRSCRWNRCILISLSDFERLIVIFRVSSIFGRVKIFTNVDQTTTGIAKTMIIQIKQVCSGFFIFNREHWVRPFLRFWFADLKNLNIYIYELCTLCIQTYNVMWDKRGRCPYSFETVLIFKNIA